MHVIDPLKSDKYVVNNTNLVVTTPAWDGGTYAPGDFVSYIDDKVYQAVQQQGPAGPPPGDPLWWYEYGVTNPYRALDGIISSLSTGGFDITYEIALNDTVDALALLNMSNISSVDIIMQDSGGTEVYNGSIDLYDAESGLYNREATLIDALPLYQNSVVFLTFNWIIGLEEASIGNIVFGRLVDLGYSQYGASFSILDYSLKETDPFGNFSILQRQFSKKISIQVVLPAERFSSVLALLIKLRSESAVWIVTDKAQYNNILLVYGFYKDFSISIQNCSFLDLSLSIEGLSEGALV